MTTFAPTFTPRVKCKYRAAGIVHTIQVRAARGTNPDGIGTLSNTLHDVFNAFASKLASDFEFISNEYALTDSTVFIPLAVPAAVTGVIAPSDYTPFQKITSTIFSGRSTNGRSRFSLYGVQWFYGDVADDPDTIPYDGIVSGAESAAVVAVRAIANGSYCSGEGIVAHWYNQATVKVNDHLLKLVRRGVIT